MDKNVVGKKISLPGLGVMNRSAKLMSASELELASLER